MRRLVVLAITVLCAAAALAPSTPRAFFDHDPLDCLELVPETAGVSGVTDDGSRPVLDVLVLLDFEETADIATARREGRDAEAAAAFAAVAAEARDLLAAAEISYDGVDTDVAWQFDLLDPYAADGNLRARPDSADAYIDAAKEQLGGVRPAGVDVVYALTDQDVSGAVAGKVDCIGGVRYDEHAFAYGEAERDDENTQLAGLGFFPDITAKIAAHEIGHLLGAHHHVANCAEGVPSKPVDDAMSVCTLMINDVGLASLDFSTPNGAVVRGHAVDHAGG